jgi:hypothetical protein
MNIEGISLGWNCSPAQIGVKFGLRNIKNNGYKTCPFDMMISNYIGLCKCIEDDFKYFCDLNYLELRPAPKMQTHIPNQDDNQMWVYNTYYNFTFNHESPFHGNLHLTEHWTGPYHFVENNFENFIKRYTDRISNFRNYLNSCDYINFILVRYNSIPYELVQILKLKYPNLKFKINTVIDFNNDTIGCLINKNYDGSRLYEMDYLRYMCIDEKQYPQEYSRYNTIPTYENSEINENIKLIYP